MALVLTSIGGYQLSAFSANTFRQLSCGSEIILAAEDLREKLAFKTGSRVIWYSELSVSAARDLNNIFFNNKNPPEFAEQLRLKLIQMREQ